jgi:hypothetical protein
MLPNLRNAMLDRALDELGKRLKDLPYLMDGTGLNVLFGRSLSYRWGWLSGLVAGQWAGPFSHTEIAPLSRVMLGRTIQRWLDLGSLNEHGVLRENLTAEGSDGGRDTYINCGHPYWGMQAFLCLAMSKKFPFWWNTPTSKLPIERGDYLEVRQGPGLVIQGRARTGEVRLFNLRNYRHNGYATYEKFCYASHFPCNAITPKQKSIWDNQLTLRLADGTGVEASQVMEVDTNDGRTLHLVWAFAHDDFRAMLHTTIVVEADGYTTEHRIDSTGQPPAGAAWIEGGFTLGAAADETIEESRDGSRAAFQTATKEVIVEILSGWETIHDVNDERVRPACLAGNDRSPNIIFAQSRHHLLRAPAGGDAVLSARHRALVRA